MAYPTVSAPYGLEPVNRVDGLPYAGATRKIQIASGYGTNIFYGDVVQIDSNGQCIRSAVTSEETAVAGVFVGVSYTNPSTKQPLFAQYWPAATVASDAFAIVVDDPMAAFKVAVVSSGTTIGSVTRAVIGANLQLVQNYASGSTTTGDSAVAALAGTVGTTDAYALRVIDVVPETATSTTAFTEVIVKINNHQYLSNQGV